MEMPFEGIKEREDTPKKGRPGTEGPAEMSTSWESEKAPGRSNSRREGLVSRIGAAEVSKEALGSKLTPLPQPVQRAGVSSPLQSLHTGPESLSNFLQVTQLCW